MEDEYIIQKGDTFWGLEEKWNIPHGILQDLNPTLNPRKLKIGQNIKMPIIFYFEIEEPSKNRYPHYINEDFTLPIDNLRVRKPKSSLGFASGVRKVTPNRTTKDYINKINYGIGSVGSVMNESKIKTTFRLATKNKGFSPKLYTSGRFFGNQYTKVYQISKLGKNLGYFGLGIGFCSDFYGVIQYSKFGANHPDAVSPLKFGVNTAIGIIGVWGGPIGATVAIIYFGFETFYTGGITQALKDTLENLEDIAHRDEEISKILGQPFRSIPYNKL